MAGTPWILRSVWWVRCGAEPVLVYRRQPGISMVWSLVLPRFFIFPRRQPLTTLVRLSFILRDSSRSCQEKSIKYRRSFTTSKGQAFCKKKSLQKNEWQHAYYCFQSKHFRRYQEWVNGKRHKENKIPSPRCQNNILTSTNFKFSHGIFVWADENQTNERTELERLIMERMPWSQSSLGLENVYREE